MEESKDCYREKLVAYGKWLKQDRKENIYTHIFCESVAIRDIYVLEKTDHGNLFGLKIHYLSRLFHFLDDARPTFWLFKHFESKELRDKHYRHLTKKMRATKQEKESHDVGEKQRT